ncbi:ferrochelatase-chloroplastic [Micractinium conductrix]|uniref:Ferrochelatase n=1 Tax=Micractinium conductrix TaxID=554055 RepID=A0A2P6V5L8_9CHLO|nr:ferrochelatase-chloroplastic [Micractinium conductrix]|eukprot:PSC69391.1 ferrochelatase-chloroplastic [Micractinium conductrix]
MSARGTEVASTSGRGAPQPRRLCRWSPPEGGAWRQAAPHWQQQQQSQRRAQRARLQAAPSPPFFERQELGGAGATLDAGAGGAAAAGGAPATERVGVLLLNLGGPDSLDDVQPFLYNLFADPDIIRLPPAVQFLQPVIAQAISTLRAPKSREGYEAIGGGSPLRRITEEQADALRDSLQRQGIDARCYVAMRYWFPFTEEAIAAVKRDGITQLVVLPLYPQFSVSTSGSSLRLLERLLKEDPVLARVKHVVIPSWYARPGYVRAMADLIQAEVARPEVFPEQSAAEIFFSAHGVPVSYIEEGDPYKEEMEECVALVMAELRRRGVANHHTLAYQSRVGPVEWLKPYTDDSIRELAKGGVRSLLAVPISFVSEHIETLEEIDCEYRELAEESGIEHWGRVPALNTNPTFIDDLADAVMEALPYVGSLARSSGSVGSLNSSDSLVPLGEVDALLETYDRDRKVLPPPFLVWKWGWTRSAETWNGRIAMLALVCILLLEATTGRGVVMSLLEVHGLVK